MDIGPIYTGCFWTKKLVFLKNKMIKANNAKIRSLNYTKMRAWYSEPFRIISFVRKQKEKITNSKNRDLNLKGES